MKSSLQVGIPLTVPIKISWIQCRGFPLSPYVLSARKVRNGKMSLHGSDVKWGIWVLKHQSGSYEQEHFCSTLRDIVRGDFVGEGPFLIAQPTQGRLLPSSPPWHQGHWERKSCPRGRGSQPSHSSNGPVSCYGNFRKQRADLTTPTLKKSQWSCLQKEESIHTGTET